MQDYKQYMCSVFHTCLLLQYYSIASPRGPQPKKSALTTGWFLVSLGWSPNVGCVFSESQVKVNNTRLDHSVYFWCWGLVLSLSRVCPLWSSVQKRSWWRWGQWNHWFDHYPEKKMNKMNIYRTTNVIILRSSSKFWDAHLQCVVLDVLLILLWCIIRAAAGPVQHLQLQKH